MRIGSVVRWQSHIGIVFEVHVYTYKVLWGYSDVKMSTEWTTNSFNDVSLVIE